MPAHFTLDVQSTTALLGKSARHGKSQPSALTDLCGGKTLGSRRISDATIICHHATGEPQ